MEKCTLYLLYNSIPTLQLYAYGGSGLGFYCATQTIRHPQTLYTSIRKNLEF